MNIFGPSFEPNKLKLQLKLAQNRIQILKTKKENLARDEKKHISELLRSKNEESARIRVETVIRDEYLIECYSILHVLCDLLINRINLIVNSSEMPIEIKESVFTVVYASQRIQIPELENIRNQLRYKYGKGLLEEVNCECSTHVNPKVVYKLSYTTPEPHVVFQYLDEISKTYNVGWAGDPIYSQQPQQQQPYMPSFSQPIYPSQFVNYQQPQPQAFPNQPQVFIQQPQQFQPQPFPQVPVNSTTTTNNNPNLPQFQNQQTFPFPQAPVTTTITTTSNNKPNNSIPNFPQFPTIFVPQQYSPQQHQSPPPSQTNTSFPQSNPSFPQSSFPQPPSLPLINEDDLNTNHLNKNQNMNTGSMDFDELTLRFENLKKNNEF